MDDIPVVNQDQGTTPHWVAVCNSNYLFSEERTSWYDAAHNCNLYGGHLLQIDDMAEDFCLLEFAQGKNTDWWWYSANDIQNEGVFRQADGNYIQWEPTWRSGHPDGGRNENCVLVKMDMSDQAGNWEDWPC